MQAILNHGLHIAVQLPAVAMSVDRGQDGDFVGMVEVNTNKFWVSFSVNEDSHIENFEVFSGRGYFELTLPIIKTIKNIAENMYEKRNIENYAY